MKLFAQIQKVDEEKRLVFGRAADETPDKSGEILNYDGSKPHFQKWSAEMSKDTDGKSLGNVRAMHGKIAVGKLTDIQFDDEAHAINVCAKVVDDGEWKKVLEGVYTGFSIGGSYGDKSVEKVDGKEYTRYIAIPNEISLVDRPCIPTAKFFQVQKADGTTANIEFKEPPAAQSAAGEVEGTPEQVDELTAVMAEKGLSLGDIIEMAKIARREDVNAKAGKEEYGDVKFADAKNKKYPLDTEEHVRAAASYWGQQKNKDKYSEEDQKTISANIAAAEKKFNIGTDDASKAETARVMKAVVAELRKGMYECSQFAQVIAALQQLKTSAAYESYREGDNSPIPARLDACIAMCGGVLKDMIDEEISEAGETGASQNVMQMAEQCGELAKHETDPVLVLVKYGARNSAGDKSRIDAIHAASVELGAECATKAASAGDMQKMDGEALEKMLADAVAPLQKALDAANVQIEKLKEQPAAPRVALRVVSKADDTGQPVEKVTEADLVKDAHGMVHPAASLIKQTIAQGGSPLVYRG